jgi:hypothetical protein
MIIVLFFKIRVIRTKLILLLILYYTFYIFIYFSRVEYYVIITKFSLAKK